MRIPSHFPQDVGVATLSSVVPPLHKLVLEATAKEKGRDSALRASTGYFLVCACVNALYTLRRAGKHGALNCFRTRNSTRNMPTSRPL